MFVAPLLTFLSDTLTHHYHAVVAQSADDGFRYTAARGQLRQSRLVGNGVDDVRRGRRTQSLRSDDANGRCGVLQLRVAGDTRDNELVQFQMTEKYIRRILLMMVLVYIRLRCHRHAYTQQ